MSAELQLIPEVYASFKTPNAYADMRAVIERSGFVAASADQRFKVPFGRDGLEFIEDIMEFEPKVAEAELIAVASLQGIMFDTDSGEEPGKMFHEHHYRFFTDNDGNRHRVEPDQEAILEALLLEWNIVDTSDEAKDMNELTVYFNSDTTQMYINRVAELCRLQKSKSFLDREVVNKDGELMTMRDSAKAALEWIERQMDASQRGYVEYQEPFPSSHRNRYWKDGYDAMLHENGEFPNYNEPIAALVVQSLTIDALKNGADLFYDEDPRQAKVWRKLADETLEHVLEDFWMEDREYFAMALDRDPQNPNIYRQIRRPASDAAAVLRTNFIKDLPDHMQEKFIAPVVERIFSDEFYTEAGIVCSSRYYPNPFNYVRYQGEETIWTKENYDIGFGLENYGLNTLADVILDGQTNLANMSQANYEYTFVIDGKVHYDPHDRLPVSGVREVIVSQRPEGKQAWAASGSAKAKRRRVARRQKKSGEDSSGWRKELTEKVVTNIDIPPLYKTRAEAFYALPTHYAFHIDTQEYERREKRAKVHDPYIKE